MDYDLFKTAFKSYMNHMEEHAAECFGMFIAETEYWKKEAQRQQERANNEARSGAALEESVGRFLACCSEDSINDNGPIQEMAKAMEPLRDWRTLDT